MKGLIETMAFIAFAIAVIALLLYYVVTKLNGIG